MLIGGRLDTNSLFLATKLGALGVDVRFKSVVGDREADIVDAVKVAVRRARVVVLTGGLGPTVDDLTRHAVARVTGRPLRRRREALDAMVALLSAWGRTPTEGQLRQALIPAGADVLINPVGTAPGFSLRWQGCLIAALPGVPNEAEQMFDKGVAPMLAGSDGARLDRRVVHTFGLIESEVDRRLNGVVRRSNLVQLGLLASPLGVLVSLTACGRPRQTEPTLTRVMTEVKKRLGDYIYAEGDETMEAVVGRQLNASGLRLALAESCTGGLIGHRLTQVPGSSAYLDRGIVCYSNEAKHELLGVSNQLLRRYGAVSAEVAAAMARGARFRSGADVALSVTGIAGPGGGSERKPVGLVYIGLNGRAGRSSETITQECRFHGDRQTVKLRASQAALNTLRQWLDRRAR